ncbi:MAG: hypothetical protein H6797_04200 [Candidatus Nomurabacteria bacterium]|nr:MAG: hypothetical protein H6797_04200 [Candidatus Nomurabacteria bacterium]
MSKSPENHSENESELTMLRSDISELFQAHADKLAFRQPKDLREPIEVILAGTYDTTYNNNPINLEVQVRQRLDDNGTDYLIIIGKQGSFKWCQITDNFASVIYDKGEKPINAEDIMVIRKVASADSTDWSTKDSQRWAGKGDLYQVAETHARRT